MKEVIYMTVSKLRIPLHSEWILIKTYLDTNTADIVNFDTGVMTTIYDIYKVIGWFKNESANAMTGCMRINGISSNTYNKIYYTTVAIASDTQTSWKFVGHSAGASNQSIFQMFIKGSNATYPLIFGNSSYSAYTQGGSLLRGDCSDSAVAVNRIQIYTDFNTTGKIRIYGMNL